MVNVGDWAQPMKFGFKAPWFGGIGNNPLPKDNKKKDEQKKTDSSSQIQEKEQAAPSFQWAENLKEEAQKVQNEKIKKIETDNAYRDQAIKDFKKDDEKASVWNTYELWWGQTGKSIANDWKKANEDTEKAYQQDLEKAKEDDGKLSFWEYAWANLKDIWRKWLRWTYNVLSTAVKSVGWLVDVAWNAVTDLFRWEAETWQQKRITNLLTEDVKKQDTVKEIATDRAIQNASIMQSKDAEVAAVADEYNKVQEDYSKTAEPAMKILTEQWYDAETAAYIIQNDVNWVATGPVWDTNYLATINALKSKKTSLEEKTNLLYQKLDEYDKLQREHQLKEYELSPFTDNYYETEAEAEKYRSLFGDKLYKNEDGTLFWVNWDQKDRDIRAILKRLETTVFSEAEWVRDEYVWKISSLFWFSEDYDGMVQHDFLKNTDNFLNMTYEVFADIKKKLSENYDSLCDTVTNGSWEEVKVLNQDKVAAFLKQNESGLARVSDYIIEAKSGTEYTDVKYWRYLDWNEDKMLQYWKDLWGLKDLLWSLTESESKEWVGVFSYDKARDWINMSTDNYGFRDWVWSMVASNPAQTAYIAGSSYFAVFGKAQWSMKWGQMIGLTKNAKWATSMAQWITNALDKWINIKRNWGAFNSLRNWINSVSKWSQSNNAVNHIVDFMARKWLWVLDEAFVSLPLDLWLNDGTSTDMWLNIWFNALWWLWKIQSIDDFHIMRRTIVNQKDPKAMRDLFAKETGLPELADKIRRGQWDKVSLINRMEKAVNNHWHNIMMSDSNKAAWFMSQLLSKNIDSIQWENLDEVDALTKAITENGNIGASLSKNRSKNIQRILAKAKSDISKTKDWTKILSIQSRALAEIKWEFKSILDSFDVEKLNKLYRRKFTADKIGQWFSEFIEQWNKATWVPKEDLMLVFMDSMTTKTWKEWSSVVELFKQRVVQWISDGSIKSSKWAKGALKEVNKIAEETDEAMWVILDISKIAENDPEKAAIMLTKLDEDWIHDMRETHKVNEAFDVATEEEKIAKWLEKEKTAIEQEKNATIEEAKRKNNYASKMDSVGTQWKWKADVAAELEDKWNRILDNAKQIAKDPALLKKIREAEEEYAKWSSSLGNELDDVIAKDKERRYNSYQDEADEAGMSLEEYHKAKNLKYDKLLEKNAVTKRLNETQWGITKEQYLKKISEAEWDGWKLPTNKRIEIIEDYLSEKYWMDFSDDFMRKQIWRDLQKVELVEQWGYITIRDAMRDVFGAEWKDWAWRGAEYKYTPEQLDELIQAVKEDAIAMAKKDKKELTKPLKDQLKDINAQIKAANKAKDEARAAELTEQAEDLQYKIWLFDERIKFIENYQIEKEAPAAMLDRVDKAYNNATSKWNKLIEQRWLTTYKTVEDSAGNKVRIKGNPYKEFSNAVNTFIEDWYNVNKVTGWEKVSLTDFEKRFKSLNWETSETRLDTFDKILDKVSPDLQKATDEWIENAEKAVEKATKQAEKTAAQKVAEAEQRALAMTEEVKKQGLQNEINAGINKMLDFFEENASLVKKTKLIDSVRTIATKMDNITQKNFFWSLGSIINDIQKWTANWAITRQLSQTIINSRWKSTVDSIVNQVKKWIANWDGSYDVVKLKEFVWNWIYEANKAKWTNQLNWKEVDKVIKEAIHLKVADNMRNAVMNVSSIVDEGKTAEEIISDVLKSSSAWIKNANLSKANQILWKQSTDAMLLYQRIMDAVTLKKTWKTIQETADETILASAKNDVSTKSQKRVDKMKKKRKIDEAAEVADEGGQETAKWWLSNMDSGLAKQISDKAKEDVKMSKSQKAATDSVKNEKLTEKEKTLMRFGAVEEASKIMEAVSKWKKPWTIRAEFLDWEWFAFLMKLLNFWEDEGKEFWLFYKAFIESRKETQGIWYQLFHWIKNVLFNWSDSLKTKKWWLRLNDLLQAIPSRITSNTKWVRTWWIIYDPRVTLTKYLMESNPKEAEAFIKWALTDYLRTALAKESRSWIAENFLKAFDKTSSNLDAPEVIADEFMNMYSKLSSRLRATGLEDRVVQDMMNPMFYNPLEYIRWVWMWGSEITLKWKELEDMVLSTILHKYQWQGNRLPEKVFDLYEEIKGKNKYFERFAWWSLIRNRNAMEFWDALWEYMNKVDSLPIWKEQFAEWINKSLWHMTNLWEDITRNITAIDSTLSPLYDMAVKTLEGDKYDEFVQELEKFLYREEWGMKKADEMLEWFDEFTAAVKRLGLSDKEVDEWLDALKQSLNSKETWESRVLTNYLYDKVSQRADDYLKATGKTPDKFNPADIMKRKELQTEIRNSYEEASTKEILDQIKRSQQKTVEKTEDGAVVTNKYKEQNKAVLEWYGWGEEETKLAEDIIGDIDMAALLEKWELPPEEAMRNVLKRIVANWESYEKLMSEKGFFREWINDSITKVLDKEEKALWREYFTVWKNWEFVLRQEADEFNWLMKKASNWTTRGNVMNQDRETQWILANLQKNKETSYVITDIDFWKILWKKDIKQTGAMWLESFISMSKASIYELTGKIKKADRSAIVQEAVNRVFRWARATAMDSKMNNGPAKEFVRFLSEYKNCIDKTRNTLELWEHWDLLFEWIEFNKWIAENKLANRLSWLWNFLSNDDISRLASKYDSSKWVNWLWKDFQKNIIYNARADLSDSKWMRVLDWLNFKAQKYAILRNYNATNITKAGQQVVSNMLHANWILKSVSVAWTSEFDDLYKTIQNSEIRNLWFDIFDSEWKYWERLFDREIKNGRKTYQWKKDSGFRKNSYLFWKDIVTSNALMRWDRATQSWAVKSSLALAVDDIYKQWWAAAVEEFTQKFKRYQELLKKYDLKERDIMDKDRFFSKSKWALNPTSSKAIKKMWLESDEAAAAKYYANVKEEQKFIYDFYRNEYAPFIGKARTSMGTFFVMDNIKELGSINVIDNNRYMFWLMKWAAGKTWEYAFDIGKAFNTFKQRGFREWLQSPVFKRLFNEMAVWARAMWEVEKMTNHEFTIEDWAKATVVPVAAVSMLIWEAALQWAERAFWREAWERHWNEMISHVFSTTLDSAYEFLTDRMFIYAGMFWTDVWSSITTANVIWIENAEEFWQAFAQTWARKFYINNPLIKYPTLRSSWYSTDASELLNQSTILAEIWLNQSSSARQVLSDVNTEIYNMAKSTYADQDKWYDKIWDWIPVIKNAKQAWVDMWVLLPMLEDKVEKSWARAFLKETTSRTELSRLINNMEKNKVLWDKDFQSWVAKNMWTLNKEDDNAVKLAMIKAGKYSDELEAWKIVKKGLAKEDLYWQWESALWLTMLPESDRNALYEEFKGMYQKYVVDKWKSEVATNDMFEKFVLAATKYGWSMSMAGYMWAYATAYKAAAREHYWLTYAEVNAWKKWDEWLAADSELDVNNIPDSKMWNFVEYVDSVREFELWFIVDNWDILSREKSIWIEMLNKYIETDKENFWWDSYLGAVWDEKSNLAKLWNTLNYNEIAKDQWLQWMIVPLAYQEKKASDNYLKLLNKAKTPEEIADAWATYLWIQETLWGLADKYIDNPQAAWLVKASLASWIVAFADNIRDKSPEVLEKVIDIIWEKAINKVLNSLTDSPTVTLADAFEIATGQNAHNWNGKKWKWKSASIPSAKARENYVNKMLIPNYNRAKAAAAATWGTGDVSLPKFTTGYGRAKDGSIVSVKIPVPQRKQLRDLPTNSIDTKTAKLDVAPLPVKEWRVIGWKYSARAIQNAKVYSRRIGK